MKRLVKGSKKWHEEMLRQNFYPHTMGNGKIIEVSLDGRYYYEKEI